VLYLIVEGHGPLEGETPPQGYICRSCGVPGHFIQHCTQEIKKPPPGYICYRCRIPGHFIQQCPTTGDPNFHQDKMNRSLAPVVTPSAVDGILESLVSAASASVIDDLPVELHCQLCKKVMIDAVLASKCCFDSFCDKCEWSLNIPYVCSNHYYLSITDVLHPLFYSYNSIISFLISQ
jgi:hypothetical protein